MWVHHSTSLSWINFTCNSLCRHSIKLTNKMFCWGDWSLKLMWGRIGKEHEGKFTCPFCWFCVKDHVLLWFATPVSKKCFHPWGVAAWESLIFSAQTQWGHTWCRGSTGVCCFNSGEDLNIALSIWALYSPGSPKLWEMRGRVFEGFCYLKQTMTV